MAKSKKKSKTNYIKILKQVIFPIVLSLALLILLAVCYQLILKDKYFPITKVGDTNISFLTKGQAIKLVESNFQKRAQQKLQFEYAQGSITLDLATASASIDYSALDKQFQDTHNNSLIFFKNTNIIPKITFNIDKQLGNLSSAVNKPAQNAKLIFNEIPSTSSASILTVADIDGFAVDKEEVKKAVSIFLLTGKYQPQLPLKVVKPKVTTDYVLKAKGILEKTFQSPIKLVFESQSWLIDTKQLLALLDLETGQPGFLDQSKTDIYLKSVALEIDQPIQEGLFEFNPDTKKVTAFRPSQEGRKLDTAKTYPLLTDVLAPQGDSLEPIALPVEIVQPKTQTGDVNSLGIKELLGRGISNFAGSIPNRIYNVGLTASKINGVLVPPGQIFSFNQTIGDISAATGFKQAYVIKEGRTVLDDGGGVCQDSTTLFRAVLNAGLPVIQRTAHAYRVGYYEQGFPPGLDATVFYPSVDFQFKNDTPAHILIQAYTSGLTLYIDLYGSSDGRTVNLTKPIITNQTPPPAELRQDDPALPKGTIKQVDWAAWGANVSFKRTVVRNGETLLNETWRSNYKPWQAVYLVGTGG